MKINNSRKILLILTILATAVLLAYFLLGVFKNNPKTESQNQKIQFELSPEVEKIIKAKADIFRPLLQSDPVISEIKESNKKHSGITLKEILALDDKFKSASAGDEFIKRLSSNPAAKALINFQDDHLAFSEIFITDKFGLNVAETNKTSDYYQADEEWWVDAYASGKGREYHGAIEFDDSAQAEAISVYIPIIEVKTNEVIGVAKAVLSIAAIKLEL